MATLGCIEGMGDDKFLYCLPLHSLIHIQVLLLRSRTRAQTANGYVCKVLYEAHQLIAEQQSNPLCCIRWLSSGLESELDFVYLVSSRAKEEVERCGK